MAQQQEVGVGTNNIVNVLIIAHPDDESMFFVPMLYHHLQQSRRCFTSTLWIVCLTTGDYDGLGVTRTAELQTAIQILSSSSSPSHGDQDDDRNNDTDANHNRVRLIQVDRPDICADHPKQAWNVENVANVLAETLRNILLQSSVVEVEQQQRQRQEATPPSPLPPQLRLFTFDRDGVSGHWNHRDTYFAVRHLLLFSANHHHRRSRPTTATATKNDDVDPTTTTSDLILPIESVWCLVTVHNPLRKYVPIWEWMRLLWQLLLMTVGGGGGRDNGPCSWAWCEQGPRRTKDDDDEHDDDPVICYRLLRPMLNWRLMRAHATQFVWYRRLFVIFSCYTYCNRFRKMRR
jgi:LmbE family N-acetylglucosaminyl deacetylase